MCLKHEYLQPIITNGILFLNDAFKAHQCRNVCLIIECIIQIVRKYNVFRTLIFERHEFLQTVGRGKRI